MRKFYRLCRNTNIENYWLEDYGKPLKIADRTVFVHLYIPKYKVRMFDFTDARTGFSLGCFLHIKNGVEFIENFIKMNQRLINQKEKEVELSPLYNKHCKYPIKKEEEELVAKNKKKARLRKDEF